MATSSQADLFTTTSVYGSRFAAEDLPKHEMLENEMPKEVAYRMIKDDLSLDGNQMLNLASFVTTYMEKEVEDLMRESFIDYEDYPQSADIQHYCVSMMVHLFNNLTTEEGAAAVGASTVGSLEAIIDAVLVMKPWQNTRKTAGKPFDKPNISMSSALQVGWEKAARCSKVEEKCVYRPEDQRSTDPRDQMRCLAAYPHPFSRSDGVLKNAEEHMSLPDEILARDPSDNEPDINEATGLTNHGHAGTNHPPELNLARNLQGKFQMFKNHIKNVHKLLDRIKGRGKLMKSIKNLDKLVKRIKGMPWRTILWFLLGSGVLAGCIAGTVLTMGTASPLFALFIAVVIWAKEDINDH